MITTIACPLDLTHPAVDPDTAPIWTDGTTDYRVASGILPDLLPTYWSEATPNRVTIICGMVGLAALAMMGLTPKEDADG